jgi:hypothetical protein
MRSSQSRRRGGPWRYTRGWRPLCPVPLRCGESRGFSGRGEGRERAQCLRSTPRPPPAFRGTIAVQDTDLRADPGLDTCIEHGRPGHGHFPLLPTSPAIAAGREAVCPRTDQLGPRRIGPCDLGAMRFLDHADLQHEEDPAPAAQVSRSSRGAVRDLQHRASLSPHACSLDARSGLWFHDPRQREALTPLESGGFF